MAWAGSTWPRREFVLGGKTILPNLQKQMRTCPDREQAQASTMTLRTSKGARQPVTKADAVSLACLGSVQIDEEQSQRGQSVLGESAVTASAGRRSSITVDPAGGMAGVPIELHKEVMNTIQKKLIQLYERP
ncbi:MAG: hypothetical protein DI604_30120 [Delftia acidovorans]|nr:MAG: hypothetical protein DI604_30120 [Delftia acidovorans]